MTELIRVVKKRKPDAFHDRLGRAANIQLLSGTHFDAKYDKRIYAIPNDSGMIDHHFAYLKTPIDDPKLKNFFLLFKAKCTKTDKLCRTPYEDDVYSFQCYFDEGEELLKMVCLLADIKTPMITAYIDLKGRQDITNIKNPFAKSTSGSALENYALSSIIDSSHYTDIEREVWFQGVVFENFLRNLLRNLSYLFDIDREQQTMKLLYDAKLEEYMKSVKVPCLYIANYEWNTEFRNIFNPKESSFRLGQYKKTPNLSEMDAVFDLIDGRDGKDDVNSLAVVECKDEGVSSSLYAEVLDKAIKYPRIKQIESLISENNSSLSEEMKQSYREALKHPKDRKIDKAQLNELLNSEPLKNVCPIFHLLLCRSCDEIKPSFLRKVKLAKDLKINILRLVKKDKDHFELVNYKKQVHSDPSMTAIIIELDVMESRMYQNLSKSI